MLVLGIREKGGWANPKCYSADDTNSATKISWLLDTRTHATGNLITDELKEYQGPALLVHNDGGNNQTNNPICVIV